jgi:glycosyltransferase involved in cell wall biosynthesis
MILTVVIPTRDKAELLDRTLAALAAQEAGRDDWEIVIVDDASSDGTAALLRDWQHRLAARLRTVRPEHNLGRAGARNLGARHARGRFILFLDDDIVAPPDLLAAHLAELTAHEDAGTIGHAVTAPEVVDAPHFHYLDTRAVAKLPVGAAPARYFVTQNAAVPRREFLSVGGFDERFAGYGFEDMELGFRLEDAGVRFRALKHPVPQHVHHHTLAEYLAKKVECGRGSLQLVARLHPHRLAEMRLDLVLDPPGAPPPAIWVRWFRTCLDGAAGQLALAAARRWPGDARHRPRLAGLYARCMDLAVLACYRRGLRESGPGGECRGKTAT